MWMRLAGHLGMSVRRCQQEVNSREFSEWIALERVEPWSQRRVDILFAQLVSEVRNALRDPKKHSEPFSLSDVMLKWDLGCRMEEAEREGEEREPMLQEDIIRNKNKFLKLFRVSGRVIEETHK